jgi:hypothetical protein
MKKLHCSERMMPDIVEVLFLSENSFTKFPFPLPKNLKELYFKGGIPLKKLPDLSHLKFLWSLDIILSKVKFLPRNLPDSIKIITIERSDIKDSLKSLPSNLILLNIESCENIKVIPDLTYLKHLKLLALTYHRESPTVIHKKTNEMSIDIDIRLD